MSRTFDDLLPTPLDAGHLAALAPLTVGADLLALLDRWVERGWLRALDRAFVAFLGERDPQADPLVLLAAALASHQLGHGHVCLDLAETLAEPDFALSLPPEGDALAGPLLLPSQLLERLDLATWCQRLQGSALVALGSSEAQASRPLVLSGQRLYLRRYWAYERRIDSALRERLEQAEPTPADLRARWMRCSKARRWPVRSTGRSSPARWPPAVRSASSPAAPAPARPPPWCVCWPCCRPRPWRSGARCVSAWPHRPARQRRVLPNPSASRWSGWPSVTPCAATSPAMSPPCTACWAAARARDIFVTMPANPLPLDVLVVDEASMIDLEMMANLLAAMPGHARLILLGTRTSWRRSRPAQCWATCAAMPRPGATALTPAAGWSRSVASRWPGSGLVEGDAQRDPLPQQVVMLRHSRRFGEGSGIGQLARQVNGQQPEQARALLEQGLADVHSLRLSGEHDRKLDTLLLQGLGRGGDSPQGYREYLHLIRQTRRRRIPPLTIHAGRRGH